MSPSMRARLLERAEEKNCPRQRPFDGHIGRAQSAVRKMRHAPRAESVAPAASLDSYAAGAQFT